MNPLKDHVAVVTGASSGIGRSIALALAGQGTEICLVARRQPELEKTARQACLNGGRGYVCCTDLTCDTEIASLGDYVEQTFGFADVLVLCGGAIFHGALDRSSLADFDTMYRANIRGHYALIQRLLPLLRKKQGQVVFINSSAGLRSPSGAGQFSATQHAFRSLADSLRDEVNADGIRVLSVYPGRTATPRIEALFAEESRPYRPELLMQPDDVAAMVLSALTLPRTAEVTDIMMRPMLKSY